jgi:hypothetical protein
MKYGELNTHDYSSIQQVIGDLQVIWTESIRSELDIEDKDFRVSISFLSFLVLVLVIAYLNWLCYSTWES